MGGGAEFELRPSDVGAEEEESGVVREIEDEASERFDENQPLTGLIEVAGQFGVPWRGIGGGDGEIENLPC